ncbi:MAG: T9SS C-terminal target domain-containing protein [Ignavibacteriae bacterium]|nr:MAG: T9SS C-terminal target domain-containing protein [Ignavibacteriota bacterium]
MFKINKSINNSTAMKNILKILFIIFLIHIAVMNDTSSQVKFRSGMFFHHSTGECIWGPNGSSTSVPQEITRYNTQHSYSGQNAVTFSETWFPVNFDNDWYLWHSIFENNDPENISNYFSGNKIIMIKSCFPSSAIEEIGQPVDTNSPDYKTVFNYKWHWRHIINVMKSHPQNFFVIWTNAPLTQEETNPISAALSKQFCKWAKDTLAAGLDPVFGGFPANVYVFDFFSKLTNSSGYLLPQYATGPHDPHPNAAATALVAPQLVNEVFDHSIIYEQLFGVKKISENIPAGFKLQQNYPNPFNPNTVINYQLSKYCNVNLIVYDVTGKAVITLVNEKQSAGTYEADFSGKGISSGVYFYSLMIDGYLIDTKKMLMVK